MLQYGCSPFLLRGSSIHCDLTLLDPSTILSLAEIQNDDVEEDNESAMKKEPYNEEKMLEMGDDDEEKEDLDAFDCGLPILSLPKSSKKSKKSVTLNDVLGEGRNQINGIELQEMPEIKMNSLPATGVPIMQNGKREEAQLAERLGSHFQHSTAPTDNVAKAKTLSKDTLTNLLKSDEKNFGPDDENVPLVKIFSGQQSKSHLMPSRRI